MKKETLIFITTILTLIITQNLFAQGTAYSTRLEYPVRADKSQVIYVGGRLYTGWAGDVSEGRGFPNQFFLNRVYLTFTGLMNDDIAFRIRLEGLGDDGAGSMALKNAFIRFRNINYLGVTSKLELGVIGAIWESFEYQIWDYRVLRRNTSGLFGYTDTTEVGANYQMSFNDDQVSLELGIWNGGFKKYTLWGYGEEVPQQFEDDRLSAGAFIFFNEEGAILKNEYGGFVFGAGIMLNNQAGDGEIANTGYRLFGTLNYIVRGEFVPHLFTIGLTGGYVFDYVKIYSAGVDQNEYTTIGDTYYLGLYFMLNFGVFDDAAKEWELIFRLDYNYNGKRGEGFSNPNDDIHQFAITAGIAIKPFSWLSIIPAFKGDYQDFASNNNLLGVWIELRY